MDRRRRNRKFVAVSLATHERLFRRAGWLASVLGHRVTIEDALCIALNDNPDAPDSQQAAQKEAVTKQEAKWATAPQK